MIADQWNALCQWTFSYSLDYLYLNRDCSHTSGYSYGIGDVKGMCLERTENSWRFCQSDYSHLSSGFPRNKDLNDCDRVFLVRTFPSSGLVKAYWCPPTNLCLCLHGFEFAWEYRRVNRQLCHLWQLKFLQICNRILLPLF